MQMPQINRIMSKRRGEHACERSEKKAKSETESFDDICEAFRKSTRFRSHTSLPFVNRWAAYAQRHRITIDEIRSMLVTLGSAIVEIPFHGLDAFIETYATHLDTPTMPFTRIMSRMMRIANACRSPQHYSNVCLRMLTRCDLPKNGIQQFLLTIESGPSANDYIELIHDIAVHLRMVVSFQSFVTALGTDCISVDRVDSSVCGMDQMHTRIDVAHAILSAYKTAGHRHTSLLTTILDTIFGVFSHWKKTNSWPTQLHREVMYLFLDWFKCSMIVPSDSFLFIYEPLIPLMVNRGICFRTSRHVDSTAFHAAIEHAIQHSRSAAITGWKGVLRLAFPNQFGPILQPVVVQRILTFLRLPNPSLLK